MADTTSESLWGILGLATAEDLIALLRGGSLTAMTPVMFEIGGGGGGTDTGSWSWML